MLQLAVFFFAYVQKCSVYMAILDDVSVIVILLGSNIKTLV